MAALGTAGPGMYLFTVNLLVQRTWSIHVLLWCFHGPHLLGNMRPISAHCKRFDSPPAVSLLVPSFPSFTGWRGGRGDSFILKPQLIHFMWTATGQCGKNRDDTTRSIWIIILSIFYMVFAVEFIQHVPRQNHRLCGCLLADGARYFPLDPFPTQRPLGRPVVPEV